MTNDLPNQVRAELADTLEDIGSAMTLLRESIADVEAGNIAGGKLCANDAVELLAGLETRFSAMTAKLAIWSDN